MAPIKIKDGEDAIFKFKMNLRSPGGRDEFQMSVEVDHGFDLLVPLSVAGSARKQDFLTKREGEPVRNLLIFSNISHPVALLRHMDAEKAREVTFKDHFVKFAMDGR
jgi:hypothetical protein